MGTGVTRGRTTGQAMSYPLGKSKKAVRKVSRNLIKETIIRPEKFGPLATHQQAGGEWGDNI